MLFTDEECASLFGITVKLLRDEAQKPFTLVETAKAMGIPAAFTVSFDMPLMKPMASSTSAASLYAAIQDHDIFTDPTAANIHLLKAHEFFKNAKYNIAARMKTVATRTLTEPAEAWVPAVPIPKHATFRGKDWVPFAEVDGVGRPRTVSHSETMATDWVAYAKGPGDTSGNGN
ncbi:hypothetical protein NW754_007013 [Fusarium falciforme]|uniref:Uncharacterized protein n=1 Tax=Fusarium falciforme TaxID=195108 RepID=A0A9W8RFR7_9HYPO|nr:hypothetical protein NW754_007013 [Fusarium falciforme]KAJ4197350.1 hypothetical protein NW755_000043 [Fusarium falciforme]KAJ4209504.1 hypothetical protein NW767_001413 [Fusarium falciforme]KAJ4262812.1 hypothetical protein NW757_001068 [Fusarium falciforme]